MKSSIVTIIWRTLVILGCLALVFACLLAWLVWGGSPGDWYFPMPELAREVELYMAISAVIGVGAIALGWFIRRRKRSVNGDRP